MEKGGLGVDRGEDGWEEGGLLKQVRYQSGNYSVLCRLHITQHILYGEEVMVSISAWKVSIYVVYPSCDCIHHEID